MLKGLLPIGTVVLLKNSSKRVMIIGVVQKQREGDGSVIWDYSGCLYPEGYIGPDKTFMFNNDQVDRIFALGYQDVEQFAFKDRTDAILKQLRGESSDN